MTKPLKLPDVLPSEFSNDAEYEAALKEVETLMNAPDGSPEGKRLDQLVTLIRAYEETN